MEDIKQILDKRILIKSIGKNKSWQKLAVEIVRKLKVNNKDRNFIFKCCKMNPNKSYMAYLFCIKNEIFDPDFFFKRYFKNG